MPKVKKDLYDIFCVFRDIGRESDNVSLGIGIAKIKWESYTKALLDFGIITKKEYAEMQEWFG